MKSAVLVLVLVVAGCSSSLSKLEEAAQRGEKALKKGRFQEAVKQFSIVVELSPESSEAYRGRSLAYFELGNVAESLRDCQAALQINSKDDGALAIRGRILSTQGKDEAALSDFNDAIEVNPQQAEARTWRAGIRLKRKQYALVIEDCNRVLEADREKSNRKKLLGEACLYRGLALFYTGEHARAEDDIAFAHVMRVNVDGLEVPCARRRSKKFTFQDESGGTAVNVERVAKIDTNPLKRGIQVFQNQKRAINALEFSLDGKFLAYGGADQMISIRNVPQWKIITNLPVTGYTVVDMEFSPDGKYLVAALVGPRTQVIGQNRTGQTLIRLWSTTSWVHIRDLPGRYTYVNFLTFSPNGRQLAACYSYFRTQSDRTYDISLWDVDSGREQARLDPGKHSVRSMSYSPDGHLVMGRGTEKRRNGAAIWTRGVTEIWDLPGKSVIRTLPENAGAVTALAFLDGGQKLVTGCDGGVVKIWDLKSKKVLIQNRTHLAWNTSLSVSPNGQFVAVAGGKNTLVFDVTSGETAFDLGSLSSRIGVPTHSDVVESVAFSRDGRYIASGSRDASVRIWSAHVAIADELPESGRFKNFKYPGIIKQAIFSPNGELIAVGGTARTIVLASAQDGRVVATLEGHKSEVLDLAFSPDGSRLASASGGVWDPDLPGEIKLWDVKGRKLLNDLNGFEGPVVNVDYSPDGKWLASCHWDKTSDLRIWYADTGQPIGVLKGHKTVHGAVFAPDGNSLASIDWLHVRVWDSSQFATLHKGKRFPAEILVS